ncbi:MAG: thiosulfate sulfurtransferase [Acidimicrobiales bacterium]|nr:thiosulfate sulfurtransferase [Acidimicrobiales bacterium]RZV46633.1 MAG: thiosulfate sulfurtransferase [Acidimicrobiales bacterium]
MDVRYIESSTLHEWLVDGEELALLDAREQGVFFDSHHFHAVPVPLSSLELELPSLVPRRNTRIVWCDSGEGDLAERAATTAAALGWENGHVLEGGTAAWAASGGELYSGVNVPSKAFGEYVEHTFGTPRIPPEELARLIDSGEDMVVLDSRPIEEFRVMSIPTGVDCPGAELVHRVKEMAPDPDTLVVVNCAGRTRSIIGTQSLINAGLENRVVALENGTMGWQLAGFEVERGHDVHAPDPSEASAEWSEAAAAAVGERFGVESVDHAQVAAWLADDDRTTYLLDVRTPGEFEAGHLSGSTNAPGGQLVQATDEYVGTRNARIVLIDDNGVRATMTASWLRQLGWTEAVVLANALAGQDLVSGPVPRQSVGSAPSISVAELAERLGSAELVVLDIGTSLKYRSKGHIPGSWWGVRSRLAEAQEAIGEVATLVLTSTDGQLAKLAVAEAQEHWPDADVVALKGGNKAWRHAGQDMEPGFTNPTTTDNDVWYKPYERDDAVGQHMVDYLTWEVALVEQINRDPTVNFPKFV